MEYDEISNGPSACLRRDLVPSSAEQSQGAATREVSGGMCQGIQETAVIRDVRLRSVLLVAALKRVTHVPAFSLALPRLLMGYAH